MPQFSLFECPVKKFENFDRSHPVSILSYIHLSMSIFIKFVERFTLFKSKYLNTEAMAEDVEACIQKFAFNQSFVTEANSSEEKFQQALVAVENEFPLKELYCILSGLTSDSFERTDTAVEWGGLHKDWCEDEFFAAIAKLNLQL